MFSRHSPLKRKQNVYRDPDYPQHDQQTEEENDKPGCSTYSSNKRLKLDNKNIEGKQLQNEDCFYMVRQIIEREFQNEIVMKQQQLEEIDERIEKAKNLLDRLRYGIVSAYYKKQEVPLTSADAASLRSSNCLFEREDKGPQMPIHPSVKKLIGKRPKNISDVIRSCPKRTAAQNAVQTIRAKSQKQKREEKMLEQIIREQGIVVDHSKQNATENNWNSLLNAAAQNSSSSNQDLTTTNIIQEKAAQKTLNTTSGKSLNSSRLNNKIKHLIIVGNTSKYIGNEMEKDIKSNTQKLTHKWLVYVQSKDTKLHIESFIKKVRFQLHHSYRPNDVVDIESPPFQVSRRGWGEFPIRVQIFFHPEFHQKPVQLLHNITLDHTLSGKQTIGAETLLEIWLREIKSVNTLNNERKTEAEILKKPETPIKMETNLLTRSEEVVDDNFLDFLNKIEASPCSISADIEKIQPTVLVNEPLVVKLETPCAEKCKIFTPTPAKSPMKIQPLIETEKISEKSLGTTTSVTSNITTTSEPVISSVAVSATQFKTPIFTNGSFTTKPMTTFVRLPICSTQFRLINTSTTVTPTATVNNIPPLRPLTPTSSKTTPTMRLVMPSTLQKSSIVYNKDGKILMPSASVTSAVRKTILPIGNGTSIPTQTSQFPNANKPQTIPIIPPLISSAPKQHLQKKLVQLVDSSGNTKCIQMLVSSIPKMPPSLAWNNTVKNTTQIVNTVTTPLPRSSNGAQLMSAATTKPNIFKIVPETIQTKPQILAFSTTPLVTTNTNTITSAHTQQQDLQLQHSINISTRTVGKITTTLPSASIVTPTLKSNNVTTLQMANKLPIPNGNSVTTIGTKNLVFQKEGKLCIIDPEQTKYRQQQKKRVSLLKPQISLLKQQQQQQQQKQKILPASVNSSATTKLTNNNNIAPQVHLFLKQQRIKSFNAVQLMQMNRILFEKKFLRQEFVNMRTAIEFLLRRLKLIVSKDSLEAAFIFVSHTLQEFHSLTAFKQRACEWLRAKNISRLIRSHKDLQRLNNISKEIYWSTKEIATFARKFAYTPPIKSLPRPGEQQTEEKNKTAFTDLIKSELKQEQNLQYVTVTDYHKISKWNGKVRHTIVDYERHEEEHEIIDVDAIQEEEEEEEKKEKSLTLSNTVSSHLPNSSAMFNYLAPPQHLENECQLVSDICRDLNVKLMHEELDTAVYHPATQTVLAQCLHIFIQNLLRQSIALKREQSTSSPTNEFICTLMPTDLTTVIANSEFDILTNNHFGSAALAKSEKSSTLQENS